jgi:hypothetical protein
MARLGRALSVATVAGVLIIVAACGGQPAQRPDESGFINQTNGAATSNDLKGLWQRAQQTLATQTIALNPVTAEFQNVAVVYVAADPRAYQVAPNGVTVTAVPDIPVSALPSVFKDKGYVDPTGVIRCSCPTGYCHAYTNNQQVWVAQSMALNDGATGWEFQNIILNRLGYDDGGR